MNGEGIMNLPAGVGGATSQDGLDSFAPLIAAQQAAKDVGYPQFTRELLSAGAEIDPAEVQEFLQAIRDAGLTSDDIAMMRRVVDLVFNEPNNYAGVREQLLAEGVPEDLLPETFDLEFFTALRLAVEEAENVAREPRPTEADMGTAVAPSTDEDMAVAPVEMAEGGIVGLPELKPIARAMASMGRQGDTMLAHITPQEAMMLKRMGGSGSINPYTGLPEFFLKKVFRGISKAVSSVGKAVKKFAKSTVGRVVLSVALGAFLGPMASGFVSGLAGTTLSAATTLGIQAGVGVFGSSLLAGDGLKKSLTNGLTAGVAAAGVSGLGGGFSTPGTGPQSFSAGVDQGLSNIKAPFRAAYDMVNPTPAGSAPVGAPGPVSGVGTAAQTPISAATDTQQFMGAIAETPASSINVPADLGQGLPGGPGYTPPLPSPSSINVPSNLGQGLPGGPGYQGGNILDRVTQGASDLTQGAKNIYTDYLSPSRASIQPPNILDVEAQLADKYPKALPGSIQKAAAQQVASQTPGMLTKYGPLAATGIGALALTGNLSSPFEVPEQEPGESYEAYMARRNAAAEKFKQENPGFFGSFQTPTFNVYSAAKGSGPQGVENFPRKNGHISGPGTGTSDDIPAMLSDGEFVFTAKAVRNMGNGSRRKGAAKMYKLMKMLEGGPVGKVG